MKQIKPIAFFVFVIFGIGTLMTQAQTTSVFTVGLNHPNKIVTAGDNLLLVTEAGTMTANTGRVSLINRSTGARQTLIDGLPSGVSNLGGPPDTDGPSGLLLTGHTLYVTIGIGDGAMNTGGPGLESPNPNPSSPIFDSVLRLTLPGDYENLTNGFALSLADQNTLKGGSSVVLTNAVGQEMTISLIADLPNTRPEPRPGFPNNTRASHLFGVELFQKNLYLADAGWNLIHKVNISNGDESTFMTFPNRPNPLFPALGGPFVEPVPDNIHRVGNQLLVPLLTGFPFAPGIAEIQTVSLKDGSNQTLIPGLRSAIDVLHVDTAEDGDSYYTLEFDANQLAGAPGRIKFFSSTDAVPVVVASTLISPTSMARDDSTGDVYVTNIFPGTITRVQFP